MIDGLVSGISDESGPYAYQCYTDSSYLDIWARPERTGFDLEESRDDLYDDAPLSINDIQKMILQKAEVFLKDDLEVARAASRERIRSFIDEKSPRYRPILAQIEDAGISVHPDIGDKELELKLHKVLHRVESEMLETGHALAAVPLDLEDEEYNARLKSLLVQAQAVKMADLAAYVAHRRIILDILRKATLRDAEGHYAREDVIHNMIMPMRTDSDESSLYSNLWLLDESLAFHHYLASDKPISAHISTDATDRKEPDLAAYRIIDNPQIIDNPLLVSDTQQPPLPSIVVVEIKRPMRTDAGDDKKDPINQAVDYLLRIRSGKIKTHSGRTIPPSDVIPGYCYIIADLTDQLRHRCLHTHALTPTPDGLGYFGFKPASNSYIQVVSYDRLVNLAVERNRAFFDRLGFAAT